MNTGEPLAIGHLLDGRYRIHKMLGVGGMGRVYLANDTRLANRPVAVKEMIVGDGAQERKAIEDFHREASVLARLSHPSIPQIVDYFGERGRHYLVMEYVAGGDLQHHLDELGAGARMSEADVVGAARQLLDVLQFLHRQKPPIIYRDLKPSNIMMDVHGRAMLIDFGIARFLPPGGRGTQIGSVGYAPPEQYLGKLEPRSDLYALAATMHHLLTGRDPQLQPPFSFPQIHELAPGVSKQTAQVIMAALDKDVSCRPQSALVMRDLLPKLPTDRNDTSGATARSIANQVRPAAIATVVLNRHLASARSPNPGSMAQVSTSSALTAARKPVTPSPTESSAGNAKADKARTPMPQSRAVAVIPARPGPPVPKSLDSPKVSATAKTTDLGLKKQLNSASNTSRKPWGEPERPRSRVVAALASVRAAIAGSSPAGAELSTPTRIVESPSQRGQPDLVARDRPRSQAPLLNGAREHGNVRSGYEVNGARLVSVPDGVQFAVCGGRLVVGRAGANGDRVDIDLSQLRRGVERISRRHAEIIKQGGDYFVRDLGSANGTYVAGRGRLSRDQLYKLKDRDQLVLGGTKLEFRQG